MLLLYLLLVAGGDILLVYLISGYTALNILKAVLFMAFNALLMLSVSLQAAHYSQP